MKKRLLPALLLCLALVLIAAAAAADSVLDIKADIPGGNTFTGPEEITMTVEVSNAGDEEMPGPVKLYYPDKKQVEEFGAPVLAAGSSRSWEGTWTLTQEELEAGYVEFYVSYAAKDPESGEVTTKAKAFRYPIVYSGAEPELEIKRTILPAVAQKNQEVSVIYEIANVGAADVSNVTLKENASVSSTAGAIKSIAAGETAKYVFTAKMGTKDLTSEATVSYKAGGKSYTTKVEPQTIKYGTMDLTATLTADKKGGAPGDTVKLTLKLKNSGKTDITGVDVKDELLGTVFTGETVRAGETLTLEKDMTITETADLQFIVSAAGAEGAALETATGRVHVVATDPTKQIVLSVEASADRNEVYKIPGGVVRFTITVRNESAVEVRNITVKAVEREVYFFDSIPSGESRSVTRDMEITMAGVFQFTASTKDELGQTVSFASNTLPIAYAPPTPVPTEAPLVTPPAPATQPIPQATDAPAWIRQTEEAADTAKWILGGVAAVLGALLLVGAVRRGHSKAQSNKAMDHLDGANYRDYSAAPRGRRRNEVVSGEEERAAAEAEAAAAETAEEAPQKAEAPAEPREDAGSEMMAETLRRLVDEPAEGAKEAAEAAESAAEEVKDAAEEVVEEVKAEAKPAARSVQEASRRRRNSRK